MFEFNLDRSIPLLTITRSGFWTLETVAAYEIELRLQLAELRRLSPCTSCIIDIRSRGVQSIDVANALQAMVGRLGILIAARTAVVAHSGLAKLQAKRVSDDSSRVFASMVLARDWVMGKPETPPLGAPKPAAARAISG